MSESDIATLAVDASFDAFGKASLYTPPSGPAVTCTVIVDSRDLDPVSFSGRPTLQGNIIEVRKSEVASPLKGGTFTITATSDIFAVKSDPKCEDPDRLVWTMTVA